MDKAVLETDLPGLNLVKRGKVRDIYDLEDHILLVATDRLSAYDVVLPDPIPGKGKILTQISLFWFDKMSSILPHHVVTANMDEFPESCQPFADILDGRSMLVRKADPLTIECVVRGYISGSGWKSYQDSGTVCGIKLPDGLKESEKLEQPIFTPSTKADVGEHDINIDFNTAAEMIGEDLANRVKDISLEIYQRGSEIAEEKGIIIADTKFEFGMSGNELILIDEVLTPDSSRFWPKEFYGAGRAQKSYDKQYVRDYLTSIQWDKKPPAPTLPENVIQNTRQKYLDALQQLTGNTYDI